MEDVMAKREELGKFVFRLSDEAFEAFEKYLISQCSDYNEYSSYQRLVIIREIIESHTGKMIDMFSKKYKDNVIYIPYVIAEKNQIDEEFTKEFFNRLCLSPTGSELFMEGLRKDLFFYAERYGREGENGLIWNHKVDSILAVCYDKPEETFAEKYKLGKGCPIRRSLLSCIKTREMMKRGY